MRPKFIVTVNGAPVSGLFYEKLIHITVTDHEGGKGDTVDCELEDGPPHLAIPKKDDDLRVWGGYADGPYDFLGAFKLDDPEVDCLPWRMRLKGHSADMREGLKQHRQRHWDDKSFGDILKQIAGENGLDAQVDAEIGAFMPENKWMGQNNESALHFAETWAARLGGAFSIKNGKLLVIKRGQGTTPGGAALGALELTPPMIVAHTCKVKWGQRERHKKVRAHHHNSKTAEREYEDVETGDPDATTTHTLRHARSGKAEAKLAAKGKAADLQREAVTTSVEIEGNPFMRAGAPFSYSGVRPGVDGIPFIASTTKHRFSRKGYTTHIEGKLQAGASPDSGGGASGSAAPASTSGAAAP